MGYKKKITLKDIESALNGIDFPTTTQIGENLYQYKSKDFTVIGSGSIMNDIDKEILKSLGIENNKGVKLWKK